MQRHFFNHEGLRLSFLDDGGNGRPLIALHAHWMEGQTYAPLSRVLAPRWRLIALDQRGHGHSDHARSYTRADYGRDLEALCGHLGLATCVMLGNSLGGVNAYQFAARNPGAVSALIIEDIGAVIADDARFVLQWAGTFPTREALEQHVGPKFAPYLRNSFREMPDGWRLAFDPADIVASQAALNGDHWRDWLASSCPALLIRGAQSPVTQAAQLEAMAARRPQTQLRTLDGGHAVHVDNPEGFHAAVEDFLAQQ
jgi:esterase